MRTRLMILGMIVLAAVLTGNPAVQPRASATAPLETRCGWFSNPTPGNISLFDREREWIIGVQGGYQVAGDWEWPEFKEPEWVKTNGNYGYGCACMKARVNKQTHKVTEIKSGRARPLSSCRADALLKKWKL